MFKLVAVPLALFSQGLLAQSPAPAPAAAIPSTTHPVTLEELFSERDLIDAAVSPSGRYLAVVVHRKTDDVLLVMDLKTQDRKPIQRIKPGDAGEGLAMHMTKVYWKSDERLLLRVSTDFEKDAKVTANLVSRIIKIGQRIFAINRDGSKAIALLADNHESAFAGAYNFGAVVSYLPKDPGHILMIVDGMTGRSLYKVDTETGLGVQVEKPGDSVSGWWIDVDGNPIVRVTASNGSLRLYRKDAEGKWRKFKSIRLRELKELPDYEAVGPSDRPGEYYVLARPPGKDRVGLYLYNLGNDQFGDPVIEDPVYDLDAAQISRDGKSVIRHCYSAHVRICKFSDPKIDAHMKGIRRYFEESANVYTVDSSEDGTSILLFVEGPRNPPGYYIYLTEKRGIDSLGAAQNSLLSMIPPKVSVIRYTARDGKELTGYLTSPASAGAAEKLPLVLMPHGGPEARDTLTFNSWVQYLVARGYAVFQPNFRGSGGFGQAFADSGYREWGRRMQDDLTDGVSTLVKQGSVDPARVCIVGFSYGGFAALAGAALTPDLYKCAVSIAGISDLGALLARHKLKWGRDSESYEYVIKAIGDPDKDEARLREVSPAAQAANIKIPVLLIHGTADPVVPVEQSKIMQRALEKAGRKTELITYAKEEHPAFSPDNEKAAMIAVDNFLWQHLGPGFGITVPPPARGEKSK